MPCPYFEPRERVASTSDKKGRLPLIDEYDGWCHLAAPGHPVIESVRLPGCNLGNLQRVCGELNRQQEAGLPVAALARFSVSGRRPGRLSVTLVEDHDGLPRAWSEVTFLPADEAFEPELGGPVRRAQLLAFCRSYLARYPLAAVTE